MPTINHVKQLLRKAEEHVRVLKSGITNIDSQISKLQKKKDQVEQMIRIRNHEVERLKKQIEDMNKTQGVE